MGEVTPEQQLATCSLLVRTWGVSPNGRWGSLTEPSLRTWWTNNNCDNLVAANGVVPPTTESDTPRRDTCVGLQAIFRLNSPNSVSSIGTLTQSYANLGCNFYVDLSAQTTTGSKASSTTVPATTTTEAALSSSPRVTLTSTSSLADASPPPSNLPSPSSSLLVGVTTPTISAEASTNQGDQSTSRDPPPNNNTATIAGSVVGVALALLLVGGVAAWLFRRRRRSKDPSAWSLASTTLDRPDAPINSSSNAHLVKLTKGESPGSAIPLVSLSCTTHEPSGDTADIITAVSSSPVPSDDLSAQPTKPPSTLVAETLSVTTEEAQRAPVQNSRPPQLSAGLYHTATVADPFSGPDPSGGLTTPAQPFESVSPIFATIPDHEDPAHGSLGRPPTEASIQSTPQMIGDAFRKAMRAGVGLQHSPSLEQMLSDNEDDLEDDLPENETIGRPSGGSLAVAALSDDDAGALSEGTNSSFGRRSKRESWLVKRGRKDRRVVVVEEEAVNQTPGSEEVLERSTNDYQQ
ncbi:hypothetical protein M427DRAFT_132284 [Gonapodya prolifera JEL478]|uniref:Uncharacterized protein n=1 Tax=Gonapodya prolifera (strain JEL478) TaxID=1344416 RepID=A0A139ARC9_GONPJ|nr:hypothetical protein M427DRAFT_132284 [Gonapodya prolifera JEL478]|eukprot:KXS19282.1 hypothetical protein M427DRAFT_132284 [Gonapodya prolifera JEL478]